MVSGGWDYDALRVLLPPPPYADQLRAVAERSEWSREAACRGASVEAFFTSTGPAREETYRRYCDLCPVRSECLAQALLARDQYGVFGGLACHERRRLDAQLVAAKDRARELFGSVARAATHRARVRAFGLGWAGNLTDTNREIHHAH